MSGQVVILGAGVSGLSAAHELAERGFRVALYERQGVPGGKARSIPVPNTGSGGRKDLPGEHGFRFFPGFYKHVTDTMKRIPYGTNPHGAFDNLVAATRTEIARVGGEGVVLPARLPQTPDDWVAAFQALISSLSVGIPDDEILFFVDRLLILLTSCEERRIAEYENISWWQFIDATNKSIAYQRFLAQGQTRSLVAMRAEESSTRTVGYILLQIYLDALGSGSSFDRLLNGPTTDVWIDPWIAHLERLNVELHFNSPLEKLQVEGGRIASVIVGGSEIRGDYYICALPVEIMAGFLTDDLKRAAPSIANLGLLKTAWMNGIQFYLGKDVPIVHGHTLYVDSPWALTSVSQKQFWSGFDLSRYGDGRVGGILSVDISDWNAPGILYGKPAVSCTAAEIKEEAWAQVKQHLNAADAKALDDAPLLYWFLDPDIKFPNPNEVTNAEPLLVNTTGSLQYRPAGRTEIVNLFLAGDYVRTYTDIACMEAANEGARRAVNALLDAQGSGAARCQLWPFEEPEFFRPLRDFDRLRFKLGLPHGKL
jgi:uncharacterized protein with NAD-binding domain and iron-sulfur cluster